MAVKRVWRGWTTRANADVYEQLLRDEVFPGIEAKGIPGYRAIELLRREADGEVEFVTIMTFDSLDSVVAFQGSDYERSYVPDAAREVLERWDSNAAHYELQERRDYDPDGSPAGR
jgi:antibiotic biosynthesis monooxygenase (ABM) superfamily enzyme